MVQDIIQGRGGFPGWKVTPENKVELDFNYFKKHFGTRANFGKFFRNVLSDAMPLTNKVQDVRRALTMMNTSIRQESQAFKKALASYELTHTPSMRYANRPVMFRQMRTEVMNVLKSLKRPYVAKWYMSFKIQFKKWDSDEMMEKTLWPKAKISLNRNDAQQKYSAIQQELETIIENMDAKNGSGWYPQRILNVWLNVHDYNPVSGKSYFPIPSYEDPKCGLVNIKNEDNRCLFWALTAATDYLAKVEKGDSKARSRNTTDRYKKQFQKYWDQLDEDVQAAIDEDGVNEELLTFVEVEKIFHTKLCVLQMVIENGECLEPFPIFQGVSDYKRKIFLLRAVKMPEDGGEEEEQQCHYVWIKNPEHFISRTFHNSNKHEDELCWDCFRAVPKSEGGLANHSCEIGFQRKIYCPKGCGDAPPTMKFNADRKSIEVPMMIVADFEALDRKSVV